MFSGFAGFIWKGVMSLCGRSTTQAGRFALRWVRCIYGRGSLSFFIKGVLLLSQRGSFCSQGSSSRPESASVLAAKAMSGSPWSRRLTASKKRPAVLDFSCVPQSRLAASRSKEPDTQSY